MAEQLFTFPVNDSPIWLWMSLSFVFILSFAVQVYYLLHFYKKLPSFKKINFKNTTDPVSVIICARNEAAHLRNFLPSVLNQFYPEFEVIVVNDGSTDETEELLREFKILYPHLYVTGIEGRPGNVSGKKVAQTLGIKAAHYDQLVFTDAGCEPVSPNWLRHMQSNFMQKTQLILGYGGYKPYPGLLNKWIRTDTVYNAMQFFSFALRGIPFMGTGRNLAFRRSLFFENKGFAKHLNVASGEDELFVNETGNRYNTAIEIHHESHTLSEPIETWKHWIKLKRKHYTALSAYRAFHKGLIALEILSRELFFITGITIILLWDFDGIVAIIILVREILFGLIFKLTMKRLNEKNLFLISLIYDVIWPFCAGSLFIMNKIKHKNPKWK